MPKITKRVIDASEPTSKDYIVWDSELKGFGCRIYPTGKKTYVFFFRVPGKRKTQCLKIGAHGNITCDIAREVARAWAGDLARGKNPKEDKEKIEIENKKSITVRDFLFLYIEKYKKIENKESTLKRDLNRIKNKIIPFLGGKTLSEITVEHILQFQGHLKDVPIQFNRCKAILSVAFEKAELLGHRDKNTNPCSEIKNYPERKRKRFLDDEELKKWSETLKVEGAFKRLSPYGVAGVRLALYTGSRHYEILALKWEDVFLDEKYIRLQDSKNGQRTIALNKAALEILKTLEKKEGNPYVFPGKIPGKHLYSFHSQWSKMRKFMELEDVTIHDLRHTFASLGIKQGLDLYQVSKLLGHKNIQTTTRYAHIARKDLIKSAEVVGEAFQES